MAKARGNVGSNLLFENERVAVWDMRLAPGQKEPIHEHKRDYLTIQIRGDRVAADFEPECKGAWAEYAGQRLEAEVTPGKVLYSEKGGVEAAVNTGSEEFYEIIVELKD
ncbi:hypothetical protein [Mycobacterium spongiae]|uniref:Cupin n=1 Tax=Mycobacterium spongiae TaxID=886343 RepID=A0A975PXI6_9MYCO|nr:hypothetical protein [Mycobacterium spongiae]QUR67798.1 hypothetical protein F6B93_12415 [Mycobacterium spongiae]